MDFRKKDIKEFFDIILKGESKTYNDHNWYTSGGLKGYIEGRNKTPYSKLKKPLSEYTIGEVKSFQSRGRDSVGQLWATGRYQIIPDTLKGVVEKVGLSNSDKYNQENQDKLALQLLMNRSSIKNYLTQKVEDNKSNLESASLSVAQIWSSVGVPYKMKGRYQQIDKNQSYYAGGGDKASVKTEDVQKALKLLRSKYKAVDEQDETLKKKNNRGVIIGSTLILLTLGLVGTFLYLAKKHPNKLPKLFNK